MTTENLSHKIRLVMGADRAMTVGDVADAMGVPFGKERNRISRAMAQMARTGILATKSETRPYTYFAARAAADMKIHDPQVYQDRKRERHRLLMQKKIAEARAARPPKPPKPPKPQHTLVLKPSKPKPEVVAVVAETVEQWMARTGNQPEKLHSFLGD